MAFCLDASVAVAAFMPNPARRQAQDFVAETLGRGEQFVAPPLLLAETTSVLRRYVHLGTLQHEQAVAALQDLLASPLRVDGRPHIYARALDLARRLGHGRAYDVQYLVVADLEGCPIITLDGGLYRSALTLGIDAHLLP